MLILNSLLRHCCWSPYEWLLAAVGCNLSEAALENSEGSFLKKQFSFS